MITDLEHATPKLAKWKTQARTRNQTKEYPFLKFYVVKLFEFVPIYNGVSPVWIWHTPVTIKDETDLLETPPELFETPHT